MKVTKNSAAHLSSRNYEDLALSTKYDFASIMAIFMAQLNSDFKEKWKIRDIYEKKNEVLSRNGSAYLYAGQTLKFQLPTLLVLYRYRVSSRKMFCYMKA